MAFSAQYQWQEFFCRSSRISGSAFRPHSDYRLVGRMHRDVRRGRDPVGLSPPLLRKLSKPFSKAGRRSRGLVLGPHQNPHPLLIIKGERMIELEAAVLVGGFNVN